MGANYTLIKYEPQYPPDKIISRLTETAKRVRLPVTNHVTGSLTLIRGVRSLVTRDPALHYRTVASGQFSDSAFQLETEAKMKKKGKANIPDFSRKRPGLPTPEQRVAAPAPANRPTIPKPHSTSQKSGRRGS